jgi:hypothetical protein
LPLMTPRRNNTSPVATDESGVAVVALQKK